MSSTHSKNEETLAVILEEVNKKLDEANYKNTTK